MSHQLLHELSTSLPRFTAQLALGNLIVIAHEGCGINYLIIDSLKNIPPTYLNKIGNTLEKEKHQKRLKSIEVWGRKNKKGMFSTMKASLLGKIEGE